MFSVVYVCNTITFESLDVEDHFGHSPHWGNTGHVRIWKSSDQGQGYRSRYGRKSLFSRCTTSIGNNSGSTEDRAVNFACSMGLSAIMDRMVWPPSSSCDRKWPRLTKDTHSPVVCLRLEGSLAFGEISQRLRFIILHSYDNALSSSSTTD